MSTESSILIMLGVMNFVMIFYGQRVMNRVSAINEKVDGLLQELSQYKIHTESRITKLETLHEAGNGHIHNPRNYTVP